MENTIYFRLRNGDLQKFHFLEAKNTIFRVENKKDNSEIQSVIKECKKPKNLTGVVVKLFDQVLEFLSDYTHCFDSLEDFPEEIALKIWKLAVEKLSKDTAETSKSIQIFGDAYPRLFLPQCIINSLNLINNYEACLPTLISNTSRLDLSGCRLDDSHDLIGQLSKLTNLEVICLANNSLTDKGLARILLPRSGLNRRNKIRYLDISDNRLNTRSLTRFGRVASLTKIVFQEDDFNQKDLIDNLGTHFKQKSRPDVENIETKGFGAGLLEVWSSVSKKSSKPIIQSDFYSNKVIKPLNDVNKHVKSNKIMFERITKVSDNGAVTNLNVKQPNNLRHQVKRRSDYCEGESKRRRIDNEDEISENEQNILNLYK